VTDQEPLLPAGGYHPPAGPDRSTADAADVGPTDDSPFAGLGFWYERRVGRAALTGLIVALVVVLVAWNLPRSVFGYEVRDETRAQLAPLVDRLALNQGWEVFAPNPSSTSIAVTADITFEDGSTARFEFPDGEPFVGALREYRWRKWERRIRLEENSGLWKPTADWIARRMSRPENIVVEVQLVRHWKRMEEAGVPGTVNVNDFDRTYRYDEVPR